MYIASQEMEMTIPFAIEEFVAMKKNTLLGFACVRTPSGLLFHDVAMHRKGDICWASPASKPQMGRDGTQMRAPDGKLLWRPVVSFSSKKARDNWSSSVIEALKASHPEAFE